MCITEGCIKLSPSLTKVSKPMIKYAARNQTNFKLSPSIKRLDAATAPTYTTVDPSNLKPGHAIIIKPGERVPADAMITYGISDVDTKALTGEATPRPVGAGGRIYRCQK